MNLSIHTALINHIYFLSRGPNVQTYEWLIRCLTPQESYNLLEVIESRCSKGAMIFCSQYEPGDWYERLHPNSEERSAIAEAILDRIIHNA